MSNSNTPTKAQLKAVKDAKVALLATQAEQLEARTSKVTAVLLGVSKGDEDNLCLHMDNSDKLWFHVSYFDKMRERTNVPTHQLLKSGRLFTYASVSHVVGDEYHDEDGAVIGKHTKPGIKASNLSGIFDYGELETIELTSQVLIKTPKQV